EDDHQHRRTDHTVNPDFIEMVDREENPLIKEQRFIKCSRVEDDPTQGDEKLRKQDAIDRQDHLLPASNFALRISPETRRKSFPDHISAVHRAPHDKRDAAAVPQPGDKHRYEQAKDFNQKGAVAAYATQQETSQRIEQIVTEPGRKADMP